MMSNAIYLNTFQSWQIQNLLCKNMPFFVKINYHYWDDFNAHFTTPLISLWILTVVKKFAIFLQLLSQINMYLRRLYLSITVWIFGIKT